MSPKSVLIVDDNQGIRDSLRAFLEERTGLNVCGEAIDGIEAIEKANDLKPNLVLMDLSMPRMNGAHASLAIRNFLPTVRIILFTLYSDNVGRLLAETSGVDLVLSKAEGSEGLTKALAQVIWESPLTN
jgi:DNA-binding NarL/FixJ family response regulator